MKMAMKDGKIMLIEVDNTQMAIIKSWNSMKYDRRKNMMIGDCSKELLDKDTCHCRGDHDTVYRCGIGRYGMPYADSNCGSSSIMYVP